MSTILNDCLGSLRDFRDRQSSQHLSPDAHAITRGLAELQASLSDAEPEPESPVQDIMTTDALLLAILGTLKRIESPLSTETSTGRVRVVLDPVGGAQSLGTVTTVGTVGTVTSMTQIGAVSAASFILDQMHAAWCLSVRSAIN